MKKMCNLYKEIRNGNPKKYIEMIGEGKYLCKKCGRVAQNLENLCCPMKINSSLDEDQIIKEASSCSMDGCEHSDKDGRPYKSKKIEKMREDELRAIIREEVYDTLKRVIDELKE